MSIVTEKPVSKLEEKELETLREIQSKTQALLTELGEIELNKISLENRRENALKFLEELQQQEKEYQTSLTEKYGKISLNPENGEFTSLG